MKPINIILNLIKVQSIVNKKFDGLSMHGISLTDYMILHILNESTGNRLKRIDLADRIGLTASGITRIIGPLEKIGLVTKENNERDARVSYVKMTETGKLIFKDANKTANYISAKILEHIDPTESELLNKQLNKLGGDF